MINSGILNHYGDVIMDTIASQITSLTIVYSTVYSDADQRKYQSSASLAFVRGIHRGPVNSPHKWPVTRKMLPFDDVIVKYCHLQVNNVSTLYVWSIKCSSSIIYIFCWDFRPIIYTISMFLMCMNFVFMYYTVLLIYVKCDISWLCY